MSRIEEALKKAASQRSTPSGEEEGNATSSALKKVDSKISPSPDAGEGFSSLLEVPPIKVDNLLLATAYDAKSDVVEEYNKLRSTVIALTKGEKFSNTLLVTSTISEEGKSMTALNLAISLAKEHDHTVLLVDTDLRRPSVHRFLGLKPDVGLVHCLRDGLPIEKALIKTGIGKLVVLPAGEAIKDPLDMLSSNRMKEIILELKQRYAERYVIFDTPPSMPFADASVLAANIDATLFVAREGRARKQDLLSTIEEFKKHNLLGVIYNDAHAFTKKNNYYYYYR
ncbi:non-specific protein-tyrosine kinase [Malonomonas rubra DSM 5091]|uniref:Non-specific protein-tyrosine kinase n=1 Tax=Malonomonas rubra DSM 5091 TaxID=1122189 RepID=A0A1M6KEN5_MALRU|nr:polysaccharide biosynthesis tyrosine autokinase [Malonomonas rubra]SHJ57421.1 non-specific protein-tyrosine kinase [Malonomonas rubra DSM 5091]